MSATDSFSFASSSSPLSLSALSSAPPSAAWSWHHLVYLLVAVIFGLALLGFNVFTYLANGTNDMTSALKPLLKVVFGGALKVVGGAAEITGDAIDATAGGAKTVVNATAATIDTGLTAIQTITPNTHGGGGSGASAKGPVPIDAAPPTSSGGGGGSEVQSSEAVSTVHSSGSGKAGWCYIGLDRGFRACAEIGVDDTCMSGDIFPSQEICMNPAMRA